MEAEPDAQVDEGLRNNCQLIRDEINQVGVQLGAVTHDDVASAVSAPPDEWGITLDERVAMARYLWKRRDALLAAMSKN